MHNKRDCAGLSCIPQYTEEVDHATG